MSSGRQTMRMMKNTNGRDGFEREPPRPRMLMTSSGRDNFTPTGEVIHTGVMCDACGTRPIVGIRYKCNACPDFDLCAACEGQGCHVAENPSHIFLKIRTAQPVPQ
eukprot:gnl/Hemi2/16110_TR5343_c0_g1_i1.p2 gnl/Hemi2/16110_TR5343_c0_g1~~gnl/Hemi2/16110_TR5343_c0_g1_i1.p2  ORF type:complete len:106 (+),score=19.25 gnl/Hemi2/16110_TR5343_c0_g1_i1:95-412(+)